MTEPMDTSNQPGESSTLDDTITDRQQQQQVISEIMNSKRKISMNVLF